MCSGQTAGFAFQLTFSMDSVVISFCVWSRCHVEEPDLVTARNVVLILC